MNYEARPKENPPIREGVWATLTVDVVALPGGEQVGSYERNYPTFYNTFHSFEKGGKAYALYSPDYTATRVMELPACTDLGGEERDSFGFCPVDYYVPCDPATGEASDLGFVAGCVWGDDTSWKIQALDLSEITRGVVARDERFGYIELPEDVTLADVVVMRLCQTEFGAECEGTYVEIQGVLRFESSSGKPLRSYDV